MNWCRSCITTGATLALLLRSAGRKVFTPYGTKVIADPSTSLVSHRGRKKHYTRELAPYLKQVWEIARCVSSVHLVAFIRANRAFLFKHPQLKTIPACLKHQLRTISHATVDRLLASTASDSSPTGPASVTRMPPG